MNARRQGNPLTLAQALDLISLDKREIPRAWGVLNNPLKSAQRLAAEYGFAAPSMTAERLAVIWENSRG